MSIWPRSLVGRNALLIVGLMLVAQLVSAVLVRELLVRPRIAQIAEAMVRNVEAMRAGLGAIPADRRAAFIDAFARLSTASFGDDDASAADPAPARVARLGGIERLFVREVSARLARRGIDALWQRDDTRRLALRLVVGESSADVSEHWLPMSGVLPVREFTGAFLVASLATGVLALVGALAIQRRLDRPLRALVDAARQLGAGVRPAPLAEDGPIEIATVAKSFNQLVADLDRAARDRTLLLAGISHDLRTPLTKLRVGVEILAGSAGADLQASLARSIDELDAMVGHFLDQARSDGAAVPVARTIDLARLAEDARAAAADGGRAIALETGAAARVKGDPALLGRAVSNLVENAFRHGRPPVVLRTGGDRETAWIEVDDAGDGIPPADAEALREPWRRGRTDADGSGLGLAIAEGIVRRHGGRLDLLPASPEPGRPRGLRARIVLPLVR